MEEDLLDDVLASVCESDRATQVYFNFILFQSSQIFFSVWITGAASIQQTLVHGMFFSNMIKNDKPIQLIPYQGKEVRLIQYRLC